MTIYHYNADLDNNLFFFSFDFSFTFPKIGHARFYNNLNLNYNLVSMVFLFSVQVGIQPQICS